MDLQCHNLRGLFSAKMLAATVDMQIAVMDGKGYQALIESKRENYDEELEGNVMLTYNGHVSSSPTQGIAFNG